MTYYSPGVDTHPLDKLPWSSFKNDGGSTAPGNGILRITGFVPDAEYPYFTVDQPNTFGAQNLHAINDTMAVSAGKRGRCVLGAVIPALYDSADGTPAPGELWGPRNGTWKLKKDTGGFRVLGVVSTEKALALVAPEPMLECLAACTSGYIQAGNSGTFEFYAGSTPGFETGTGSTVSVYVREGMSIQNELHRIRWVNGRWELANPSMSFRGVTVGSAVPGATCDVTIYFWGGSSWAGSSTTISGVLNDLDVTVASGATVPNVVWNNRASVPGWRITQTSYTCP